MLEEEMYVKQNGPLGQELNSVACRESPDSIWWILHPCNLSLALCNACKLELCECRSLRRLFDSCLLTLNEWELDVRDALMQRAAVAFDSSNPNHEALLQAYQRSMTGKEKLGNISWKDLGFQSDNPRTDFRGGGLLSLECMTYFSKVFPTELKRIVSDCRDDRLKKSVLSQMAYSAVFVNIAFVLVVYFKLNSRPAILMSSPNPTVSTVMNAVASPRALKCFFAILVDDSVAFEELFCASSIKFFLTWRTMCLSRESDDSPTAHFNEALASVKEKVMEMFDDCSAPPERSSDFHCLYRPLPPQGTDEGLHFSNIHKRSKST